MRRKYLESAPLVDESGDLWISRIWLEEVMPEVRPADFLYLVCKTAGVPLTIPGTTKVQIRHRLQGKGLL